MKKSLLIGAIAVVAFMNNFKAQTTWDFSSSAWPVTAGETAATLKNNIALVPGPETVLNFAQVEANSATFPDFVATKRFKLNGGGYASTGVNTTPTQRYLYFRVNGNSEIKISYKNGGGGDRTLYIGTGTEVLAFNKYSNSTDPLTFTYQYVGPARDIYVYGDSAINLYRMSATNVGTTTLSVNDVTKTMKTKVYAIGNTIHVSDLDAKNTEVNVYTATGSLVKKMNTSADAQFEINTKGVYIVNVKSSAGAKSVKVLVN